MNRVIINSVLATLLVPALAFAEDGSSHATYAIAAAIAFGLAAVGGTLGQGKAVSSGLEAIGRNPAAQGKVFVPLLLGLALIESLVILGFVVANTLLGKL